MCQYVSSCTVTKEQTRKLTPSPAGHTVYMHPCIVCLLLEKMYNPESLIFSSEDEHRQQKYVEGLFRRPLDFIIMTCYNFVRAITN